MAKFNHEYNEDDHRKSFLANLGPKHSDRMLLERLKRDHGESGGHEMKPSAPTGTPSGGTSGVGGAMDPKVPGEMADEADGDNGPHPEGCMCGDCKAMRKGKSHHHPGGDVDMAALDSVTREG